jgi:EAL domain-containing protein (putative c-di-GMP-specific phosphodiesterase class I)
VQDGGLVLHYQPQFDIRRKRIVGAEALLRWNHPEFGLLAPEDFLPPARQTRAIVEIGAWVLRTGCQQAADWQSRGLHSLRLGLNVASEQFQTPDLAEVVASALGDSGVRPDSIELEITEGSLLEDIETTTETLNTFDRLGVRLALDDFGTGYSSLAYLKRLPIDTVKIDQCFVQSLVADAADAAITQAIVSLAHELNMSTLAEGVEDLDQLLLLGSYGCNRMQGFLFGRPVPIETFEEWLDAPPFHWGNGGGAA